MSELSALSAQLSEMVLALHRIEALMLARLPIPLAAGACIGCKLAMDHIGPLPYCSSCIVSLGLGGA